VSTDYFFRQTTIVLWQEIKFTDTKTHSIRILTGWSNCAVPHPNSQGIRSGALKISKLTVRERSIDRKIACQHFPASGIIFSALRGGVIGRCGRGRRESRMRIKSLRSRFPPVAAARETSNNYKGRQAVETTRSRTDLGKRYNMRNERILAAATGELWHPVYENTHTRTNSTKLHQTFKHYDIPDHWAARFYIRVRDACARRLVKVEMLVTFILTASESRAWLRRGYKAHLRALSA